MTNQLIEKKQANISVIEFNQISKTFLREQAELLVESINRATGKQLKLKPKMED